MTAGRILIVDDDVRLAGVLVELLAGENFQPAHVSSGAAALSCFPRRSSTSWSWTWWCRRWMDSDRGRTPPRAVWSQLTSPTSGRKLCLDPGEAMDSGVIEGCETLASVPSKPTSRATALAGVRPARAWMSSGVPPNPARSNRCAASARLQSERSMGVRSFCQAAGPDARAASDAVAGAARTRPRGCVEAYSDSSRTSISILFLLRGVGGTGLTSRRLLGPSHE